MPSPCWRHAKRRFGKVAGLRLDGEVRGLASSQIPRCGVQLHSSGRLPEGSLSGREFAAASHMCLLILTDSDRSARLLDDCKLRGISILPPDINQSDWFFTAPDGKTIRYGLGGIRCRRRRDSLPDGGAKGKRSWDLFDLARMKRDSAGLCAGCLKDLSGGDLRHHRSGPRKTVRKPGSGYEAAADAALFADQGSLFGDTDEPERIVNWIPVTPGASTKSCCSKGSVGFCLTGRLFGECRDEIRKFIPEPFIRSSLPAAVRRQEPKRATARRTLSGSPALLWISGR